MAQTLTQSEIDALLNQAELEFLDIEADFKKKETKSFSYKKDNVTKGIYVDPKILERKDYNIVCGDCDKKMTTQYLYTGSFKITFVYCSCCGHAVRV